MQEYNSPDEYIEEVKGYIKWKRAKGVATKEISDHITDQYEAFLDEDFSEQDAMKKAIQEMGSANVVGAELNLVHRPKTNWVLLLLTGLLLLAGVIVSLMTTSTAITIPKMAGIILGFIAVVIVYFSDYTILIRFPKLLYGILAVITFATFVFELRNGFAYLGYSYTFYILLCFPIALIGVLFSIKNSDTNMSITVYMLYACFPLALALLDKALPVFIVLLISEIFIFACGLKWGWLKWNKINIIGATCILLVFIIAFYFINQFYGLISDKLLMNTGGFYLFDFQKIYQESVFIGESQLKISADVMGYLQDHPVTLLIMKYGRLSVILLLAVFGGVIYLLYRAGKRQDTEIGKMLTNVVLLILTVQVLNTVLSDIGILPNFFMCLPFIVTGGAFIIYDFILIDIVLSVHRNESIARDWVKLKDKQKESKWINRFMKK